MSKYEARSLIYNLDFLSGKPGIFISGYKYFGTLFGSITTIIIIMLSASHILYEFSLFFFERKMTIIELEDNYMTKETSIPLNDFLFAFNVFNNNMTLEYFWGKEINSQSGNISRIPFKNNYTAILYYENPETKEIINKYQLEIEPCETEKNINQNLIEKYNFTEYKNYLCLSKNSNNFDIVINKTHNTYIDIVISITIENQEDYGIENINSDNFSTLFKLNYLEFQLYSPNDIISNKNMTNPIKYRKNFFTYELISPGELERNQINTKFIDYSSDNGFFLKNIENFKCFSVGSITKTTRDLSRFKEVQNLIYSEFRLYLNSDGIESYERTYQKLPDVIADITGILSLLFTLGKFYVEFFCKIFLEVETLSRIFQYKFNSSSKKKLKQNNNSIIIHKNIDNESSQRGIKNSLRGNINIKSKIKKNKNTKIKNTNRIKVYSQSNELSFKNNSSKKMIFNSNNSQNNVNNKDNNSNIINNNSSKKNIFNKNSVRYSKEFLSIIEKNKIKKKRNCTKSYTFSFCDYFCFIFKKDKNNRNNKTKIIEKLSSFFEDSLSLEEIIGRTIDLENIIYYIKKKLGTGLNLSDYMRILLKRDIEFKQIIEDENKNNFIYN